MPDGATRALRRRIAHRSSLVQQRTRLRNRIHAVLMRNLMSCPVSDLFGQAGRRWLAEVALPEDERAQVESALRLLAPLAMDVDILKREKDRIDDELAALEARGKVSLKRLEEAKEVVEGGLRLLDNGYVSYVEATEHGRRRLNEVLFKRINVTGKRVVGVEYQEPLRTVFSWVGSNKKVWTRE